MSKPSAWDKVESTSYPEIRRIWSRRGRSISRRQMWRRRGRGSSKRIQYFLQSRPTTFSNVALGISYRRRRIRLVKSVLRAFIAPILLEESDLLCLIGDIAISTSFRARKVRARGTLDRCRSVFRCACFSEASRRYPARSLGRSWGRGGCSRGDLPYA
jgi:hypothetical protein